MLEDLDLWCLKIRQAAEVAEYAAVEIHRRIHSLVKAGYLQDSLFLGEHIWQIPASDYCDCDALGSIYQPALWTWQGYGILTWNALLIYNCNAFEKSLIFRDHEQLLNELRRKYSL